MNIPGVTRLGVGLSGIALLVIVTLHTVYWYNVPEIPFIAVLMILVVFIGSGVAAIISHYDDPIRIRFTE